MRKIAITIITSLLASAACAAIIVGCHADPDDPAGQAKELEDPVRRQNAIANLHRLYTSALAAHEGDRNHADVKKIADAACEALAKTYIDHPEDNQNGLNILELLKEMNDPRGLPALVKALNWRPEVNEEHAIRASQALQDVEIADDKKPEVIAALSEALEKVTGTRGVDNRMRIEFIRALGSLRDQRTLPTLTKIALAQTEEQNFLINRLAAQQIGELGRPESVAPMIKGLFLFAPNNPAMRMNDVAAEALVRIGRPAVQPLLQVLRGEHRDANQIAEQFIAAVRQRDEAAARTMNARTITSNEATFALGALGFADSLDAILAESREQDVGRKVGAALALVRLQTSGPQQAQVRDAVKAVYTSLPANTLDGARAKMQLIAAMRYTYDAELLSFFLAEAQKQDLFPDVRLEAVSSYALLANKAETAQLRAFIQREPASEDGGYRESFQQNEPLLAAADQCDANVGCWVQKLGDRDTKVVRKAAYMLGRLGRGNDGAITALVAKLDHMDIEVRLAVVQALDHIVTGGGAGTTAAITKIDEMRRSEEGRAIWTQFSREALPIQARLRARSGS